MSIPVIDKIEPLGNFPVVKAEHVGVDDLRLDSVLNTSALELSKKANKEYVDEQISSIPKVTKTSQLQNDSGFLTQHQDLSAYAKKSEIPSVPTKTSQLQNDSGFLTQHQSLAEYVKTTDSRLTNARPASDVKAWAKADSKPTYTASEVGALPESTEIPSKVSELENDENYITKNYVDGMTDKINDISGILGSSNFIYKALIPIKGGYFRCNGGIGSIVDLTPVPSVDSNSYVVADCKAGDEFLVSAKGGTAPRAWCFIDSENKILDVADEWAHVMEHTVIAPERTSKIIICDSYGAISFKKIKKDVTSAVEAQCTNKPINIKNLGIVGEGNTINAELLNRVLKSLNSVYIPAGHYFVDGTISTSGTIVGEYSAPAIDSNGVWDLKTSQNTVLDFSGIEQNVAVSVSWGGEVRNITIVRDDYKQSENRELARQGNNQPIYVTTNKNENGVCLKLRSYSAKATNVQVIGAGDSGIWCETYGYVNNCHAQMCRIGYRLQGNDNQVNNIRAQAVTIGLYTDPGSALNNVVNVRVDSAATHGAVIRGIGSTFTDLILDGCYYSGLHIEGSGNAIDGIQTRCCLSYPRRTKQPLSRETYDKTCAVSFESGANNNIVSNIPTMRPNIMDNTPEIYNMDYIIGFYGANYSNTIKLYGEERADETVSTISTLASVVSGNNAPNTAIEHGGKMYYSESFTSMNGDLVIDGVANYDVNSPRLGMIKVTNGNAYIYTGTAWKPLTN